MAYTYKNYTVTDASTGGSTVLTVAASTTTIVIGFRIINKSTTVAIEVDATAAGVNAIGLNTVIPIGGALEVCDGSKIVLETTDTISVTPDTATSCDVVLSVLEIT